MSDFYQIILIGYGLAVGLGIAVLFPLGHFQEKVIEQVISKDGNELEARKKKFKNVLWKEFIFDTFYALICFYLLFSDPIGRIFSGVLVVTTIFDFILNVIQANNMQKVKDLLEKRRAHKGIVLVRLMALACIIGILI